MLTYETIKTITIDASEKSRAEEREKEREQCCKDICPYCRQASPVLRVYDDKTGWQHSGWEGDDYRFDCRAAAIRERAYQEQEGT